MAVTSAHSNNKMIRFRTEIVREYVRENLFSPYYGDDITAIIRNIYELKQGGEQINIPLVAKLSGAAKGTGTLVGNEEAIDNYGFRVWLDWARNAVTTNKADQHKDSADVFAEAKPLLSDWGKELQRDELILALHALPSTAAPANLGSASGQRVNGILYSAADATAKNAWNAANVDRVQFGGSVANYSGTHATALANVDATDKLTAASVTLMKRRAKKASPKIRPYKTKDGKEYYVLFCGSYQFRDLKGDAIITAANREARSREGDAIDNNPLFQDGDLLYDGVIVREVPEMDTLCTVTGAGASGIDVAPCFLCGQMAATLAWGQMPKPTERKEDDYGFIKGSGVEMAYGVAKLAKIPAGGSALRDWGVYTGYFASVADA
jgi:N4-gp56 family major capsid protein